MIPVYFVCWALFGQHWSCAPAFTQFSDAVTFFHSLPRDHEHLASLWSSDRDHAEADVAKYQTKLEATR